MICLKFTHHDIRAGRRGAYPVELHSYLVYHSGVNLDFRITDFTGVTTSGIQACLRQNLYTLVSR